MKINKMRQVKFMVAEERYDELEALAGAQGISLEDYARLRTSDRFVEAQAVAREANELLDHLGPIMAELKRRQIDDIWHMLHSRLLGLNQMAMRYSEAASGRPLPLVTIVLPNTPETRGEPADVIEMRKPENP